MVFFSNYPQGLGCLQYADRVETNVFRKAPLTALKVLLNKHAGKVGSFYAPFIFIHG
jgi:hypothetical protein